MSACCDQSRGVENAKVEIYATTAFVQMTELGSSSPPPKVVFEAVGGCFRRGHALDLLHGETACTKRRCRLLALWKPALGCIKTNR